MELDITEMPPQMVIYFSLVFFGWIIPDVEALSFSSHFQVQPRAICLNDFLKVIGHNHKTISQEDIGKFEEFTAHMGQTG